MPPETSKRTPLWESNEAGHSSEDFSDMANMNHEEKEQEVRPPPATTRRICHVLYTGSSLHRLGSRSTQLRPPSSPLSGASPRQLPHPSSFLGASAATYCTTVLRLQDVVDLRLGSEGIHVIEQTMQRIGKLTRNSSRHGQRLHRSRHPRLMLSRTLTGVVVFHLGSSGMTRRCQV